MHNATGNDLSPQKDTRVFWILREKNKLFWLQGGQSSERYFRKGITFKLGIKIWSPWDMPRHGKRTK